MGGNFGGGVLWGELLGASRLVKLEFVKLWGGTLGGELLGASRLVKFELVKLWGGLWGAPLRDYLSLMGDETIKTTLRHHGPSHKDESKDPDLDPR